MFLSVAVLFFFNVTKTDFGTVKSYFQSTKDTSPLDKNSKERLVIEEKHTTNNVLVADALDSLQLEDSVIEVLDSPTKQSSNVLVDIPLLDDTQEPMDTELPQGRKKVHLEIIESTSVKAYKDVEDRFYQSEDINDALFLAKSYYRNGNYKKSEYWALQANRLDETIEESLLIFVKSKVKLGSKNEAISILTSYLKKSNSREAKKLLYQIENDKL